MLRSAADGSKEANCGVAVMPWLSVALTPKTPSMMALHQLPLEEQVQSVM